MATFYIPKKVPDFIKMSLNGVFFWKKTLPASLSAMRNFSFKSPFSLDKLYPESINISSFKPPESSDGKFSGYIPIKNLEITYSKSSGSGGQHVQKTETKVDIRFHVKTATWLSESTKEALLKKYYTRINKDGYFIVRSEKTKSRLINTADALNYIREIIFKLEQPPLNPDPMTLEKFKKIKEKNTRLRLMEKRRHSLLKAAKLDV